MVHEVTFDASEAVRAVLADVPAAAVAVEEHGVGYRVNRHFPAGELDGEMILADFEHMITDPVSRVIIRDPDSTSEDFVNLARRLGLQGTNYFIGWTAWLDLAPEGVSKASGLEWVCRELGVAAADVLAIGDGRNDIEMLRWAGRGVAMGQAPDRVKAAADGVAPPVPEDGAAAELRRWFGSAGGAPEATPPHWTCRGWYLTAGCAWSWSPPTRRPTCSPDAAARLAPGLPRARTTSTRSRWCARTPPDPSWGPRHVVRAFDGLVVGSIGFFGPPEAATTGCRRPRSATAWSSTPAATARPPRRSRAARRDRPARRPGPRQRAAGEPAQSSGCSPSAASPSCAAPTTKATW